MISAAVALVCSQEIGYARQYYHGTRAFWLAEAGINKYMKDPALLDAATSKEYDYGNGKLLLTKDDSKPGLRLIVSTGTFAGISKKIQITYLSSVPEVYKNALSSNGNISINGDKTSAYLSGQIRINGNVTGSSHNAEVFFENIAQGVDNNLTSLVFNNSQSAVTLDNFTNQMNVLVASYPQDQVVNIKNDNLTVTADTLNGKKIVYVEGNVTINSNDVINAGQNITIIASGTVTFNQSGEQPENSQLNIIAYGGYNETVSKPSSYRGLIYTHGTAKFDKIKAASVSNGSIIADGGVVLGDIWATKIFKYADMATNEKYPSGFEAFTGGTISIMSEKPIAWKQLWN